MIVNDWRHYVRTSKVFRLLHIDQSPVWRYSLQCSSEFKGPYHSLLQGRVTYLVEPDSIVEVSDSAFDNWDDLSVFAAEVSGLLGCEPQTIIRAMS
jgi:hypothetical protein